MEAPTVYRRLLGGELRRLREAAGFSLDDAAQFLECDRSKISRIETGHRGMRPKELRELLAEYGVEDERRHALAELARQARKRGWWQQYAAVLPEPYLDFISMEDGATTEHTFQAHVIPDLLQTEAYAQSLTEASPGSAPEHQQLIAANSTRQQVLTREPNALQLRTIVGEAALHQLVGDNPTTMRNQLRHLMQIHNERPNVTLQVLPLDAHAPAAHFGSFTVLRFPPPTDLGVVHLDNLCGGLHLETPTDVDTYQLAFEHLTARALSTEASIALISKIAEEARPNPIDHHRRNNHNDAPPLPKHLAGLIGALPGPADAPTATPIRATDATHD